MDVVGKNGGDFIRCWSGGNVSLGGEEDSVVEVEVDVVVEVEEDD